MNISLTEEMHSFIIERVHAGCHSSASEYIRSLVRRDRMDHNERVSKIATLPPPRRANDYMVEINEGDSRLRPYVVDEQ
ncbi:MAG: type II toxin-antitoxin system ParD family antitoxin [Pyrinomonadaceae bacterium]